jgi:hypothetical protein
MPGARLFNTFILFLFLSSFTVTAQTGNLLPDWAETDPDKAWKLSNAKIIEESKTGNQLLKITGKGNAYQDILLPEGSKGIKIKAFIKAVGTRSSGAAAIQITAFSSNGEELVLKKNSIANDSDNSKWNLVKANLLLHSNTTKIRIICSSSFEDGEAYFDEVFLKPTFHTLAFYDYSYELPFKEDWQSFQSEKNIVLNNGGFERGMDGWPDWAGEATDEVFHYGNRSLKVEQITEDPQWIMRRQRLIIPPNTKAIKVSGWIKTERVFNTPAEWEGARIYLQFVDNTGAEIKVSNDGVGRAVGTTDWTQYSAELIIPENATLIWLHCGLANVPGTAYFDDIKVEFVSKEESKP